MIRENLPSNGFYDNGKGTEASIDAGFIVMLIGDVMTMPGLPKQPAALRMDVSENENAAGLF
jgi:formate--tetrahydrofolate ligase